MDTRHENEALDRIYNNLKAGNRYGHTSSEPNGRSFFTVNIHAHSDRGKEMFYYTHHGSSAVEATKDQLAWLLGTIFKMSPEEFEQNYTLRGEEPHRPVPRVMSYKEFMDYVQAHIKEFLPDDYKEAVVDIKNDMNTKTGIKDGVLIRRENEGVIPVLYANDFWKPGFTENDLQKTLDKMAEIRYRANVPDQSKVISDLQSFKDVKDHIVPRLVRSKGNEQYLSDKPHIRYQDMEIMYTINIDHLPNLEGEGRGSTPITYDLMSKYGIDQETLYSIALDNIQNTGYSLQSMMSMFVPPEVLASDPELAEQPPFILTTPDKMFGATMLLNERALKDIGKQLNGDYVVCPSSVHEVLILPMSPEVKIEDLTKIVQDINNSVVMPEDVLADHPFIYDNAVGVLLSPQQYFKYNDFDPMRLTPERFNAFTKHATSRQLIDTDKNAMVYEMNGTKVLASFGEPVAFIKNDEVYRLKNEYSYQVEYHMKFFAEHEAVKRVHDASEIPMYQDPVTKEIKDEIQKATKQITPAARAALFDQGNDRTR